MLQSNFIQTGVCMKTEAQRAAQRAYYQRNKERLTQKVKERYAVKREAILFQQKERYAEFRNDILKKNKEWRDRNPEKLALYHRKKHLGNLYGITIEQFEAMWGVQKGRCANYKCDAVLSEENGGHAIDHSHKTGKVRAILCRACNVSLGLMKDDVNKISGLMLYLERYGS
jgi:hypothetical protein